MNYNLIKSVVLSFLFLVVTQLSFAQKPINPLLTKEVIKVYSYQNNVYIRKTDDVQFSGFVKIFTQNGTLVSTEKLNDQAINKYTINAESGIYIVRLVVGNEVYTEKIIIRNF